MKKKLLIIADSIKRQTGYSTVATNIINNLDMDKFEVAQLGLADIPVDYSKTKLPVHHYSVMKDHSRCCRRGHLIEYYNKDTGELVNLVPNLTVDNHPQQGACPQGTNMPGDMFAQESAFFTIQHFKPDIVVAINDVWALYHYNFLRNRKDFVYVPYLAVDSECFPMLIHAQKPGMPPIDTLKFFALNDETVVFTNFAKKEVDKTVALATDGGKLAKDIKIIPHGVDINAFKPLDNKKELRKKYFQIDDDNVFLIGCVQRNQPRKRMDAIFQTLKILKDKYENKGRKIMVHFHCAMNDNLGWDLPHLGKVYGVLDSCVFDNKLAPGMGVPVDVLNEIINCYDIHLTLTNSEGWGLPILETMSAGIPNVITDYSAHGDWASGTALKVKLAAKIHEVKTNHIKGIADINDAAKNVSLLYNSKPMLKEYKKKSLKLANKLEWAKVCTQWNTLLDSVDIGKLEEGRYDLTVIEDSNKSIIPENPVTTPFTLVEV